MYKDIEDQTDKLEGFCFTDKDGFKNTLTLPSGNRCSLADDAGNIDISIHVDDLKKWSKLFTTMAIHLENKGTKNV